MNVKETAAKILDPFEGQDEESLFKIFTATAQDHPLPMEALAPHQIRGMGLCICLAGEVRISIDLKHYTVHKGEMFIILPGVVIQPIGRSDDFVGYVLGLKPDRVVEIDSSVGLQFYLTVRDNPCLALHDGDLQTLLELCDLIKKKLQRTGHPYHREVVEHLILTLFYEISAICHRGQPLRQKARRRQEELFEKFLYLVATHYRTQRSLNFYAEQMCLTPKYLSSIIKQASGESATEWIIHTVIRNAQALLENSQLTVQQVADYLNFPTPSFFGQYFKKHVGMTPKEYRLSKR